MFQVNQYPAVNINETQINHFESHIALQRLHEYAQTAILVFSPDVEEMCLFVHNSSTSGSMVSFSVSAPLLTLYYFTFTAFSESHAAEENNQLDRVTLQLKWFHRFQFAGYYAALQQGYYAEEGLEVLIKEGGPLRSCQFRNTCLGTGPETINKPADLIDKKLISHQNTVPTPS